MISRVKIQFREEIGATKFIYCGNQKAILDSDSIKSFIVCATTPSTILFLDQKDRRGEGIGVGADDSLLEAFWQPYSLFVPFGYRGIYIA